LTYRCLECGLDFYVKEPQGGVSDEILNDDHIIDDEETLRATEEELKRQTEQDDDRRCR
jgi:hypothetical protein